MDERLEETFVSLAKGAPGQRSIWWRGTWWSRSCLMELVEGCETTLSQSGFQEGQRIAVLLPNSPVTLALCLAAWRLGGTVIPLNVQAGEKEILRCTAHADVFGAYLCKGFEPLAEALARNGVPSAIAPLEGPIRRPCRPGRTTRNPRNGRHLLYLWNDGLSQGGLHYPRQHPVQRERIPAPFHRTAGQRGLPERLAELPYPGLHCMRDAAYAGRNGTGHRPDVHARRGNPGSHADGERDDRDHGPDDGRSPRGCCRQERPHPRTSISLPQAETACRRRSRHDPLNCWGFPSWRATASLKLPRSWPSTPLIPRTSRARSARSFPASRHKSGIPEDSRSRRGRKAASGSRVPP